jgi:pimeloyl-ACP methyl ester carboxylesterase
MTRQALSQPAVVVANGVELCVQTFGDPERPAILLIPGAASPMDWWDEQLCERLAAGGRFVIRYDPRDTGQSVSYAPGAPGYTGKDLGEDAVGVLDALGISRAHIVGMSMGGGVAQELATDHPARVASLTLMSTSPVWPRPGKPKLPPMAERLAAVFADPAPEPDWSDREAVMDYLVEDARPYSGSIPFDERRMRSLAERIVDRTMNVASMKNHFALEDGEPPSSRGQIRTPTLVLHGTEDPLFPYAHGEALAAEIPGARLVPLEGVGHELPPPHLWDLVVGAILDHTARAEEGG